jgi:hypothetical protein
MGDELERIVKETFMIWSCQYLPVGTEEDYEKSSVTILVAKTRTPHLRNISVVC